MREVRPNWLFIAGVASCFVVPWLATMLPFSPRLTGAVLGLVAFVVLAFRFADRYTETQTVGRVGVLLIMGSLLLGAIGQIDLLGDAPLSKATIPLIGQRWGVLLMGLCYGRLLGLGHATPWVRPREAPTTDASRPRSPSVGS